MSRQPLNLNSEQLESQAKKLRGSIENNFKSLDIFGKAITLTFQGKDTF